MNFLHLSIYIYFFNYYAAVNSLCRSIGIFIKIKKWFFRLIQLRKLCCLDSYCVKFQRLIRWWAKITQAWTQNAFSHFIIILLIDGCGKLWGIIYFAIFTFIHRTLHHVCVHRGHVLPVADTLHWRLRYYTFGLLRRKNSFQTFSFVERGSCVLHEILFVVSAFKLLLLINLFNQLITVYISNVFVFLLFLIRLNLYALGFATWPGPSLFSFYFLWFINRSLSFIIITLLSSFILAWNDWLVHIGIVGRVFVDDGFDLSLGSIILWLQTICDITNIRRSHWCW